jgi:lambda family phage holin
MPEKDASLWISAWHALPEPVKAAILAALVALLRVMYDDREPRYIRRFLEAALCGAIAFGVGSGVDAMVASAGMAQFVGGFIGLLGADKVRELGQRYVKRKVEASE